MELLKLKRRLKTAQRGYKLLKEKRDGLMKKFTEIVRQIRSQRAALESALADSFKRFALTTSFLHQKELEEMFLVPSASVGVEVHQENVPVTFRGLEDGQYLYEETPLLGGRKSLTKTVSLGSITEEVSLLPNSVVLIELTRL